MAAVPRSAPHDFQREIERRKTRNAWLLLTPALVVTLIAAIAPLIMIVWVSFWTIENFALVRSFDTGAWSEVIHSETYRRLAWSTIKTVLIVLALLCVFGITAGYFLARFVTNRKLQALLLLLAVLPFWTSYVIRIITWQPLFGNSGVINYFFGKVGLPHMSLFLYNQRTMIFALTSLYVVFVIGPVFWAFSRIEPDVIAASRGLGAGAFRTFWNVELPLAKGGLIVGLFFATVFLLGDYATGRIIGGGTNPLISDVISNTSGSGQWPIAAALAVVLFIMALIALAIYMKIYDLRREL